MTRRIEGYREPIACIACGHRQQPTLLWLTCEYCGIVLEEHPHFKDEEKEKCQMLTAKDSRTHQKAR